MISLFMFFGIAFCTYLVSKKVEKSFKGPSRFRGPERPIEIFWTLIMCMSMLVAIIAYLSLVLSPFSRQM